MQNDRGNSRVKATYKSADTEEVIDIYFYRPLGYWWARMFERLGVGPNTVSVMSIILGVAAGVCFYFGSMAVNVIGMLLLIWANTFDSADGQLARMTGRATAFGRMLDGFCGDAWFVAIYAAICARLTPDWGVWIWVVGAVAGYCHTRQAALADYYRNVHLLFLKGRKGSELSASDAVWEEFRRISWRGDFLLKTGSLIYANYTKGQEDRTPRLQRLMAVLAGRYGEGVPAGFRDAFRKKSLPLMKYANMLSFNTRAIALFASLGVGLPWLYFVFEATVLNVMLIYVHVTHEGFCATFTRQIES
ncbi:MAG: CDP-alcohol phosphatidyltransferase family protein [Tannerellaceae bacterium]|jgi:hypothetical protein|nr:CDP-alcohol phosphatidyltransferase family protein [Tannerellaceae bacterium]